MKIKNGLHSLEETVAAIQTGAGLVISADESVLGKLPKGNWIGASSPYSMSARGGALLRDQAYIQDLPKFVSQIRIRAYNRDSIKNIYKDGFDNGFSLILLPVFSEILTDFALKVPSFAQFGLKPLMGWVAGQSMDQLGKVPAQVFDGTSLKAYSDQAVVLHAELNNDKYADIGTVNIFEISDQGDVFRFADDALEPSEVFVNDTPLNFAAYLKKHNVDLRWPLVGEYNGTTVNASFMAIDETSGTVKMFAPVFKGVHYRLAKAAGDYQNYLEAFRQNMPTIPTANVVVTCNCMFNYIYGGLEGKPLDELNGPFVFGEVAYQLLNQTMVYLSVHDK